MNLNDIKNRFKAYLDKKMLDNMPYCFRNPKEKLSQEEVKMLLYIIEFSDQIIDEYGSIEKWKKLCIRVDLSHIYIVIFQK